MRYALITLLSIALITPSVFAVSSGRIVGWGEQVTGVDLTGAFMRVAAGGYHSIALRPDGSIAAWGFNGYGQATPPSGTDFVTISAGRFHCLALRPDGSIVAWGDAYAYWGQPSETGFVAIAAGDSHSLALRSDGSILAWGAGQPGQSGWRDRGQCDVPSPNAGFVAIAAGDLHSIALRADGSVVAWGSNTDWNGTWTGQATAPSGTDFIAIAAGESHSLACGPMEALWVGALTIGVRRCRRPGVIS